MRARTVNFNLVRWMVLGSVPAAFLGAYLLHLIGHTKSAQNNIETALGAALLIGAAAMALRYVLDRRDGQDRTAVVHELTPRPLPTVAIGVIGGLIVGMTSVGSGSLMIVLLLFLYPTIGAKQLVGTDLTQAVPLTAAAALGALVFGHVEFGVTGSLIIGSVPAVVVGSLLSVHDPGPIRAAGDRLRDPRVRPEVRRARDDGARLGPVRGVARRGRGMVAHSSSVGARNEDLDARRAGSGERFGKHRAPAL